MALKLSYHTGTYRPTDAELAGNGTASSPVEFDLAPAEGTDLARIKSILVSTAGLVADAWNAGGQDAVIHAFTTGAPAFVNTITAIRGLTVPAALAVRVGLPVVEGVDEVAIVNGAAFSRVCGFSELLVLSMHVANEILKLTNRQTVDPRLFVQPSGSRQQGMADQGAGTNAAAAQTRHDGNATAAGPAQTGRRRRGTSRPSQ